MNRRFEMARHAYTTVPFYRELAEKEPQILMWIESGQWEKLPLVEKNQIVLQQDKFISDDYLAELVMERLNRTHTSGSTGPILMYTGVRQICRLLCSLCGWKGFDKLEYEQTIEFAFLIRHYKKITRLRAIKC